MSSNRRPWYPWYPKDFVVDEKVQSLSDDAELLYRRILDILWQANTLQMPSNCLRLANAIAKGWPIEKFEKAWSEIQFPGSELLKTTEDGEWIYSTRLLKEAQKIEDIQKKRSELGKKGYEAKAKQLLKQLPKQELKLRLSHTDTDTDIKENTPISPKEKKRPKVFEPPTVEMVREFFLEKGFNPSQAERAYEYYSVANWKDSQGAPVKNWKQKMLANWMKEDQKPSAKPELVISHCGMRRL